jgi:hypothetical protein
VRLAKELVHLLERAVAVAFSRALALHASLRPAGSGDRHRRGEERRKGTGMLVGAIGREPTDYRGGEGEEEGYDHRSAGRDMAEIAPGAEADEVEQIGQYRRRATYEIRGPRPPRTDDAPARATTARTTYPAQTWVERRSSSVK